MLQLKNVIKKYNTKAGEVKALDGVSLTFASNGMVFVLGKSGSGKTTLLNVVGGLDGIDGGEISMQNKEFSTFTAKEYDDYRNTFIGFVFQEYNLLSEFDVEYNIKIAMELQGEPIDEKEFTRLLQEMEIEDLRNRKPSELSGGQRQRVAIARALVKQPRIIMADEPTGALDSTTGTQVLDMLKKLSKEKLVIVVSHDEEFAEKYADRIIRLVDGKVVEDITFTEKESTENICETESGLIVRGGAELSETETNTLVKAIKERKKVEIIEKISFRDKRETGEITQKYEEYVALKRSKMKWRSSAYLGVKSLAVKPIRLILTILLSAIAFAVFGLFDTIANLNMEKILTNHLSQSSSSTLVSDAEYIVDYAAEDKYALKVSQTTLDGLAKETGGAVKGIFDFYDNTSGNISHTKLISEVVSSKVVLGRKYYANSINGFIEFDCETELNADGKFKDFDYCLVEGSYPMLSYDNGTLVESSLNQVAISTYLADSIIFFLNDQTLNGQLNGKSIMEYSDLLMAKITIEQEVYTIVGIIDCGKIPKKYDVLRQSMPSEVSKTALVDDYAAFIDSSARKCLFVGAGFMRERNALDNSSELYYVGKVDWTMSVNGSSIGKPIANYVYNANDYDQQNVLLFSGVYEENGSITLAANEILLNYESLEDMLSGEINALNGATQRSQARELIRSLKRGSAISNRQSLAELFSILGLNWSDGVNVTVEHHAMATGKKITQDWKLVGVYFRVDENNYTSRYKLMVGESFMDTYHIYHQQGDYNKILFSKKSVEKGMSTIVAYLTGKNGFVLNWYNNSILSIISKNETMVQQIARLFLYVALALASISVFMLYNYISTSISSKRRSIGVLRALGASGKDILRTFLSESLSIAIINGGLACVFSAIGCTLVNSYIMDTMNIFVAFALFGLRQVFVILGISLLTALLSSALPIIKISKKKPVELISRS